MKRSLALGVAMLVAATLLSPRAAAQDRPRHDGDAPKPAVREKVIERLIEELQLTADQATKVKQVLDTFKQANENWEKEHGQELKDAREKLQAARKDANQDDLKAARGVMMKIEATRKDLVDNLRKQLAEVPLTAEQVDKIVRFVAPPLGPGQRPPEGPGPLRPFMRPMAVLRELNLSDQQMAQAKKVLDGAKAAADKAEGPKAKEELLKAAFERVKKEILTDEQREKLTDLEKAAQAAAGSGAGAGAGDELPPMLRPLNLSDDQKTKAKAILADAMKAADSPEKKREAVRAALKKISDDVLTADQQEALKKIMEGGKPASRPARPAAEPTGARN